MKRTYKLGRFCVAFSAFLLISLLTVHPSQASSVSRTFSKTTAGFSENITVSLTVSVTGGNTYYAIDETFSPGWTFVTSPLGNNSEQWHVKFVLVEGAANTVLTYIVRTPGQEGNYTFHGIYMFEGMANEADVTGQNMVKVQACTNCTQNIDLNGDGKVDIFDLIIVAGSFGRTSYSSQWNPAADVVANGEIDIYDIVFVASRFD